MTAPPTLLARLRRRSRTAARDRWRRVRAIGTVAVQTGLAAGLSWFVAKDVLDHPQPFFAPIAAVITLDITAGQRLRRTAEFVIGVALGIAVGDALVYLIRTGAWQLGLVVTLAMVVAVLVGGRPPLVIQAASSAVLVGALAPPTIDVHLTRFLDALIGGGIALGVIALLPVNPLTAVSRVAEQVLAVLADGLAQVATALRDRDGEQAQLALRRMADAEQDLGYLMEVLPAGRELATVSPLRWPAREAVVHYIEAARPVSRALRNARVLARRAVTLLDDDEPVPAQLPPALDSLAASIRALRQELAEGRAPDRISDGVLAAVRQAAQAYGAGLGFSGTVVVAQVRTVATDLLGTAGLTHAEANRLVRRAGGTPATYR